MQSRSSQIAPMERRTFFIINNLTIDCSYGTKHGFLLRLVLYASGTKHGFILKWFCVPAEHFTGSIIVSGFGSVPAERIMQSRSSQIAPMERRTFFIINNLTIDCSYGTKHGFILRLVLYASGTKHGFILKWFCVPAEHFTGSIIVSGFGSVPAERIMQSRSSQIAPMERRTFFIINNLTIDCSYGTKHGFLLRLVLYASGTKHGFILKWFCVPAEHFTGSIIVSGFGSVPAERIMQSRSSQIVPIERKTFFIINNLPINCSYGTKYSPISEIVRLPRTIHYKPFDKLRVTTSNYLNEF